MQKLIQFIADNGEAYGINLNTVMAVLTQEEIENLGNQGEKAIRTFFAEEFDRLFDKTFSC